MDNPDDGRICMARWDPRQRGLFAAAWLVGYAAQTGEAALKTLTVGALTGDFGLLDAEAGKVRPVFHLARGLSALAGQDRVPVNSSDEARVLGLASRGCDGRVTLWAANLTDRTQALRIASTDTAWLRAVLDHDAMPRSGGGRFPDEAPCSDAPVHLPPYAVARFRSA